MVAEYITNKDRVEKSLPEDFAFEVHSWNGRGAIRIQSHLDSYLGNRESLPPIAAEDLSDMSLYYESLFGAATDPDHQSSQKGP
jgi:hypothetical protein